MDAIMRCPPRGGWSPERRVARTGSYPSRWLVACSPGGLRRRGLQGETLDRVEHLDRPIEDVAPQDRLAQRGHAFVTRFGRLAQRRVPGVRHALLVVRR